jgi:NAD(P)-dependent dehydrogenase (short-subunit alcohol dehydrogenase family)
MTTDKKTWLITGAGRGMGVDFAKAALAAGHNVVAAGRNPDAVAAALGESDDLLVVKLDITSPHDAEAATKAAIERFGGIDVLVNNAANHFAGVLRGAHARADRAPAHGQPLRAHERHPRRPAVMRKRRSGHVVTISSTAGFAAYEGGTAYATSKFAVDGWMESLAPEIAPFGIRTTAVNPGFFRTELLTNESTSYASASIEDYAERNAAQREFFQDMNGKQVGDPAKLAQALLTITELEQPPLRFIAGADAIAAAEQKLTERQQQIDAFRELSTSLAHDDVPVTA